MLRSRNEIDFELSGGYRERAPRPGEPAYVDARSCRDVPDKAKGRVVATDVRQRLSRTAHHIPAVPIWPQEAERCAGRAIEDRVGGVVEPSVFVYTKGEDARTVSLASNEAR